MHVTIVHLTESMDADHLDEGIVFAENQGKFGDGVEERRGADFNADIDHLYRTLGPACTMRGNTRNGERRVPWIEVDPSKTDELFVEPWNRFQEAVRQLADATLADFTDGSSKVEDAMLTLRDSYDFDWLYVVGEYGYAKSLAEWIRELRRDADGGDDAIRRFYVHASYDGDQ